MCSYESGILVRVCLRLFGCRYNIWIFEQMIPTQDLKKLVANYGPNRCFVSLGLNKQNLFSVKTVVDCGVKNIEVTRVKNIPTSTDYLKYLKDKNHTLYCKRNDLHMNLFDGIVVKGSEAAASGHSRPCDTRAWPHRPRVGQPHVRDTARAQRAWRVPVRAIGWTVFENQLGTGFVH